VYASFVLGLYLVTEEKRGRQSLFVIRPQFLLLAKAEKDKGLGIFLHILGQLLGMLIEVLLDAVGVEDELGVAPRLQNLDVFGGDLLILLKPIVLAGHFPVRVVIADVVEVVQVSLANPTLIRILERGVHVVDSEQTS
jgi:hypothetical protein